MNKTLQFFMDRPNLVAQLPTELQEKLLAAVREQLANAGGRGSWLPPSAQEAMTSAVDDKLMSDLVADGRRSNEPGFLKPKDGPAVERGSGWSKPAPLEGSVPGIRIMDQMMDVQDAVDRRELEGKLKR